MTDLWSWDYWRRLSAITWLQFQHLAMGWQLQWLQYPVAMWLRFVTCSYQLSMSQVKGEVNKRLQVSPIPPAFMSNHGIYLPLCSIVPVLCSAHLQNCPPVLHSAHFWRPSPSPVVLACQPACHWFLIFPCQSHMKSSNNSPGVKEATRTSGIAIVRWCGHLTSHFITVLLRNRNYDPL